MFLLQPVSYSLAINSRAKTRLHLIFQNLVLVHVHKSSCGFIKLFQDNNTDLAISTYKT